MACVTVFLEPFIVSAVSFTTIFSKHASKTAVNVYFCCRHWAQSSKKKEGRSDRQMSHYRAKKSQISGQFQSFWYWFLAMQGSGIPNYCGESYRHASVSCRVIVHGSTNWCCVASWCPVSVILGVIKIGQKKRKKKKKRPLPGSPSGLPTCSEGRNTLVL